MNKLFAGKQNNGFFTVDSLPKFVDMIKENLEDVVAEAEDEADFSHDDEDK